MFILFMVWILCIHQAGLGSSQSIDCASGPCQNDALCQDTESGFQCFCVDGYAGEFCEINFNDCSSIPCRNNATCIDHVASYTCVCAEGFAGPDCEVNVNECESSPCPGNGTCIDIVNGYICECTPPFRGDHCELLPCDTVPCENEALCRNDLSFNESLSGFVCECITGFSGPRCEINLEDCDLENYTSCSGNGLCIDGINDYSCLCEPGWVGDYCEFPVDDCIGNSCKNNATCTDLHLGYQCTCEPGYEGSLCERERDECSEWQPCKNGASCVDLFDEYRCECAKGWFGVNCTEEVDECETNECQNDAQCLDVIGGFQCRCAPFYTGLLCETQYNPCAPEYNPCQNGANCVVPPDGIFICFCATGFTGVHCEVNVNECLSTPCENNATCEDITSGYICHCTQGWEGQNCQDNIDDCALGPCLNGADCIDLLNGFECNCTRDYQGPVCDEAVNYCLNQPCFHDSTCLSFVGGYTCMCSSPYTGDHCLDLIDSCQSLPCLNNGTCMNTMTGFICSCPLPYTGNTCSDRIDFCKSEPCFLGTCVSLDNDFVCVCPEYITGKQCTDLVDYCGDSPCKNEGNCINGEFDFRCVCAYGFTGRTCTEMIDFCSDIPCLNDANCTNIPGGFECICPVEYTGDLCQTLLPTVISSNSAFASSSFSEISSQEAILSSIQHSSASAFSSPSSTVLSFSAPSSINMTSSSIKLDSSETASLVESVEISTDSIYPSFSFFSTKRVVVSTLSANVLTKTQSNPVSLQSLESSASMIKPSFSRTERSDGIVLSSRTDATLINTEVSSATEKTKPSSTIESSILVSTYSTNIFITGSLKTTALTDELVLVSYSTPVFVSLSVKDSVSSTESSEIISVYAPPSSSTFSQMLYLSTGRTYLDFSVSTILLSSVISDSITDISDSITDISVSSKSPYYTSTTHFFTSGLPNFSTSVTDGISSTPQVFSGYSILSTESSYRTMKVSQYSDLKSSSTSLNSASLSTFTSEFFKNTSPSLYTSSTISSTSALDIFSLTSIELAPEYSSSNLKDSVTLTSVSTIALTSNTPETPTLTKIPSLVYSLESFGTSTFIAMKSDFSSISTIKSDTFFSEKTSTISYGLKPSSVDASYLSPSMSEDTSTVSYSMNKDSGSSYKSSLSVLSSLGSVSSFLADSLTSPQFTSFATTGSSTNVIKESLKDSMTSSVSVYVKSKLSLTSELIETAFESFSSGLQTSVLKSVSMNYEFPSQTVSVTSKIHVQSSSDQRFIPTFTSIGKTKSSVSEFTQDSTMKLSGITLSISHTTVQIASTSLSTYAIMSDRSLQIESSISFGISRPSSSEPDIVSLQPSETSLPFRSTYTISLKDAPMFLSSEVFDASSSRTFISPTETLKPTTSLHFSSTYTISLKDAPTSLSSEVFDASSSRTFISPTETLKPTTSLHFSSTYTISLKDAPMSLSSEVSDASSSRTFVISPIGTLKPTTSSKFHSKETSSLQSSLLAGSVTSTTTRMFQSSYKSLSSNFLVSTDHSTEFQKTLFKSFINTIVTNTATLPEVVQSSYTIKPSKTVRSTFNSVQSEDIFPTQVSSESALKFISSKGVQSTSTITPSESKWSQKTYILSKTVSPIDFISSSSTVQFSTPISSVSTTTTAPPTSCENTVCHNGGVCRADVSGTYCDCGDRYLGPQCDTESTACSGYVCENGGVCVVTLTIYNVQVPRCNCPLPFVGTRCESEKLIYYPAFIGSSYLEFPSLAISPGQSNEIYITVKTTQRDATILYSANHDVDNKQAAFVSLQLTSGKLRYLFSCDGIMIGAVETDMIVNTGDVHEIVIRQVWSAGPGEWCTAAIIINSNPFVSDPVLTLRQSQTLWKLYIGGKPRFTYQDHSIQQTHIMDGFIGCVHNFQVNQKEIDLVTMAITGINIDNCNVPVCQYNPCKNGATCYSSGEEWHCGCLPGYGGALCERKLCGVNPCQHGGTCIVLEEEQDQLCLCAYGRGGVFCENAMSVKLPHFVGNQFGYSSYLAYNHPHYLENDFEMEFSLIIDNVSYDSSLIAFMGNTGSYDGRRDFMAIGVERGYVIFRFDLGSGYGHIYSAEELDQSLHQHAIKLGRDRYMGWLQIDNQRNMTGRSPGVLTALNTNSKLYIGNIEYSEIGVLPSGVDFGDGFTGCIFNLKIKSHISEFLAPGNPPGHVVEGRNVGQCSSMSCEKNPCQNGAECRELGSSIYCICVQGWKGTFCTDEISVCDLAHACANGSTCVPTVSGGFSCLCPLGKKGVNCDQDLTISDPLFLGEGSYMAFDPVYIKKKTDIRIQIKPNKSDGLLFYVAQHLHSHAGDFLSITLTKRKIEMRVDLGTGVNMIRSEMELNIGTWYTIEAGRNITHGYITVDGSSTTVQMTGMMTFLDTTSNFYIGGLPSLDDVSPDAFENEPETFQGCFREFVVNSKHFQLDHNGAKDGRNIEDCDGTSCGYSVCQNKGNCSVYDNNTFNCFCSPFFVGTTCEIPIACANHTCVNGNCKGSGEDSYVCDCSLGWIGEFCDTNIELNTSVGLTPGSFIYFVDGNIMARNKSKSDISFAFKTTKLSGLIVWSGQTYSEDEDYLGVGIQDGLLKLVWNLGWYSRSEIVTSEKFNDGLWHNVVVKRVKQMLILDIDGVIYDSRVSGDFVDLDTFGEYFIGSFKEGSVEDMTLGHFTETFSGCLKDFKVNEDDEYIVFTAVNDGKNIVPCDPD